MSTLYDLLLSPFVDFAFMRRALAGCLALALGSAPVGLFLVMRRMSLMGDAMSHAVLPGAAVGYLLAGLSLPAMSLGGFVAGVLVAVLAGLATRYTEVKEDASFAGFYLLSLSLGVLLVSKTGSNVDLMHLLFGSALAVDLPTLHGMLSVAAISLTVLLLIYRPLALDSLDPLFLRSVSRIGPLVHGLFLALVVLNLVMGFQAIGALMVVGLMMLPAAAARFWSRHLPHLLLLAALIGATSVWLGLLLSYHAGLPSGPCIVLLAGLAYLISVIAGPVHGLWRPAPLPTSP